MHKNRKNKKMQIFSKILLLLLLIYNEIIINFVIKESARGSPIIRSRYRRFMRNTVCECHWLRMLDTIY